MTPETILSLIAQRVHPIHRAKIAPDANLHDDLHLCAIDLWSIACDMEEQADAMFASDPAWETVADVIAAGAELGVVRV